VIWNRSYLEMTAFITKFGLFEFLKVPFGISNPTATWVRLLDLAREGLRVSCVAAFADDGVNIWGY